MGVNDHDTFTGLTPLHKAAADGKLEDVIALMDDGADVDIQANGENNSGKTAAMFAASAGHVDVLKAMQRGPSLLNLQSADGGTPAMSAAAHGFADVLQFIIDKKCDLDKQDEDGWTALMYAVCSNNVENVKRLVNAGANVNIKTNDGETAAQLAGGKHKDEILRALKMKPGSLKSIPEGGKKKGCVIM